MSLLMTRLRIFHWNFYDSPELLHVPVATLEKSFNPSLNGISRFFAVFSCTDKIEELKIIFKLLFTFDSFEPFYFCYNVRPFFSSIVTDVRS